MMRRTKYLFVTGGVASSLGKGITAASLALLLQRRGFSVRLQKFDPYLNVDPGTMSPYQHGEVYVLDDGTEADLDLGHYERFAPSQLDRRSSVTMGRVYQAVLRREREGDYLGKTVQTIPHVTDAVKAAMRHLASSDDRVAPQVVIIEVGGTVGDIEAMPILEAARQLSQELPREDCAFLHLTLIPYLKAAGEAKSKPTQHSVMQLRQIGIQPDLLLCRSERPLLGPDDIAKIGLFCNLRESCVVELPDGESIYDVPGMLAERGLDSLVCSRLQLCDGLPLDLGDWQEFTAARRHARDSGRPARVCLVGKYVSHADAYKSVEEALDHAAAALGVCLEVVRLDSESLEGPRVYTGTAEVIAADGILIPGGFGTRGIDGKLRACRMARESHIPFLGICLGMQLAVVEFARHITGLDQAHSAEFLPEGRHPVVAILPEQASVTAKGGTMRLGAYPMRLTPGSKIESAYRARGVSDLPVERHRHRYEINPDFLPSLTASGLRVGATSPDGRLVEAVELPEHPWFVGVQGHPEFTSRPTRPHPLFLAFVAAAADHRTRHSL